MDTYGHLSHVTSNIPIMFGTLDPWRQNFNCFYKIYYLSIFPYKSIRGQIWPCHRGFVGPRVPNAHIKFQGHQPLHLGDFYRVFYHMGMVADLVIWPGPFWTNFRSPIPVRLHMKFGFDWPNGSWDVQRVSTKDERRWQMNDVGLIQQLTGLQGTQEWILNDMYWH